MHFALSGATLTCVVAIPKPEVFGTVISRSIPAIDRITQDLNLAMRLYAPYFSQISG
jgi:hypothetical protein